MIEVLKPGLETCVQDYPGRKGAFGMGFPPSGPIDHWSFRLANILVGNEPGAAALECQFIGPILKFQRDAIIALARLPLDIRGFGPVKAANEAKAAKRREELLAVIRAGGPELRKAAE